MRAPLSARTLVRTDPRSRRRAIRTAAAAASTAAALLYLGIGFGVLRVVDMTAPDAPDLLPFGLAAGAAFGLGAALLLAFDRRILWILGALLQVAVIVMYVVVAPQRTPPFETWGILIKILQAAILAALVTLIVRPIAGPAHRSAS